MGYTTPVSDELTKELREKGMPVGTKQLYRPEGPGLRGIAASGVGLRRPTYAEVFDWFASKGVHICMTHRWRYTENKVIDYLPIVNQYSLFFTSDWKKAANAAIEKGLELMKGN